MKRIFALLISVMIYYSAYASDVYYTGIARNTSGTVVTNQYVSVRVKIAPNDDTGNPVLVETHSVYPDNFGAYSILIGNGTNVSGSLDAVDVTTDI